MELPRQALTWAGAPCLCRLRPGAPVESGPFCGTVQHRETVALAKAVITQACQQQQIARDQLTVHADRSPSMTSKPVAFLLADLGALKTHARRHTATDNPYSQAQFKTLEYRPGFPARFSSIDEARAFCREFFGWYNHQHRHSGIGLMTPATVHQVKSR